MELRKIPLSQINPAAYNPRKDLQPGDAEYARLKKSIQEFDLVEPLIWNERSGNLVGGHQRLKIIKNELGLSEVDVSVVNLDPQKEMALNIALNKISGDWDIPKLKELLVSLDDGAFDLALTGFDENELKKLIDYEGRQGLTDEDDVPGLSAEIITKTGTLWHLGEHRLLCGDATSLPDVTYLMNGQKADLVFTDPPYNVDYKARITGMKIQNDKMEPEEFENFLVVAFESMVAASKDGASFYVWHNFISQTIFENALKSAELDIRSQIVWAKNNFTMGARYRPQHELCFYAHRKDQDGAWYGNKDQSTLWQENKPSANKLHPTMKPVELVSRAIRNSSKPGDLMLDLFGGSGSGLIACEKSNRTAYLMELDPAYCDVIVRRWEKYTGKQAVQAILMSNVQSAESFPQLTEAVSA